MFCSGYRPTDLFIHAIPPPKILSIRKSRRRSRRRCAEDDDNFFLCSEFGTPLPPLENYSAAASGISNGAPARQSELTQAGRKMDGGTAEGSTKKCYRCKK